MTRYKVGRPFIAFGMYHEVGEIITDVSIIDNFEVKLWDCTIEPIDETGRTKPKVKKPDVVPEVTETPEAPETPIIVPITEPVIEPVKKEVKVEDATKKVVSKTAVKAVIKTTPTK